MDPKPVLLLSLIDRKIADLFAEHPQLMKVFIASHAACVGCVFSAYCVLRDALELYPLDPAVIMKEIPARIDFKN